MFRVVHKVTAVLCTITLLTSTSQAPDSKCTLCRVKYNNYYIVGYYFNVPTKGRCKYFSLCTFPIVIHITMHVYEITLAVEWCMPWFRVIFFR